MTEEEIAKFLKMKGKRFYEDFHIEVTVEDFVMPWAETPYEQTILLRKKDNWSKESYMEDVAYSEIKTRYDSYRLIPVVSE
jgi:hypothetical protein